MPPMLDVSDEVRAEIGAEEADRLLTGESVPDSYDCASCRRPGDAEQERTSTVLFLGGEMAVLAFAHTSCVSSQVVTVSDAQLQDAVRSLTDHDTADTGEDTGPDASAVALPATRSESPTDVQQAVLGVTCGQVVVNDRLWPALVVEPTSPIARPGSGETEDAFLPMLIEQGFQAITDVAKAPGAVTGWSVAFALGQLHAILQTSADDGRSSAWWQAHQPLRVTDEWRAAVRKQNTVLVYAAPVGAIGPQPREDLLREALDRAAARGTLVAAAMPLAGT